ncbi:histidinol-phosphate transaminase [Reinekea sp.]|jgi:histidinol-phosphate aminotransferase|uniref:histidinol-phosphate transaminase n=1 Tax=Reinekea sp. TaxID=1970455 RepID=UPI00398974BE
MNNLISSLLPESIKNLIPYQSARRIGATGHLYLNANELEQPLPCSNPQQPLNRYPDFKPQQLAEAYLDFCQVEADCLAVRGADEGIELLVRTFCAPAVDNILICTPTYGMYEICATASGVGVHRVPLTADFELDIPSIETLLPTTKLIFICAPNNPTGNLLDSSSIRHLLEKTKESHVVAVDEAYIEYSEQDSVLPLLAEFPNLVIIRTLSKAFGLAALRVGFVVGSPVMINALRKLIAPYPIPDPCADIAIDALQPSNVEQMRAAVKKQNKIKQQFCDQLSESEWVERIYPSATNFVLVRFKPSLNPFDLLIAEGIVTRNQSHEPALQDCVRITIGSEQSMAEIISALNNKKREI